MALATCHWHPDRDGALRCADCGLSMCRACYDAAPAPWKLCGPCTERKLAAAVPAARTAEGATCPSCQRTVPTDHRFCGYCGVSLPEQPLVLVGGAGSGSYAAASSTLSTSIMAASSPTPDRARQVKNPGLAAVLSLVWCGLGQLYNGQVAKGILVGVLYLVLAVFFWTVIALVPLFVMWVWGMIDAYRTASRLNSAGQASL